MFNFSHVLIHNNSMDIYKDEPLSASQVHTNYLKVVKLTTVTLKVRAFIIF